MFPWSQEAIFPTSPLPIQTSVVMNDVREK